MRLIFLSSRSGLSEDPGSRLAEPDYLAGYGISPSRARWPAGDFSTTTFAIPVAIIGQLYL
jgi:hypothetical protein